MPLSWSIPAKIKKPAPPIEDKDKIFGRDIRWQGDFEITPAGDWRNIDGWENLRQALFRRLMTTPGEHRFLPDYGGGLRAAVKTQLSRTKRDELEERVKAQSLADPRVEAVDDVSIERITLAGREVVRITLRVKAFAETRRLEVTVPTGG